MKSPDVSYVIPAHNAEEYLAEAINSCLTQTHKNIEVLVVDDNSVDATKELTEWYAKKDKRVRYLLLQGAGRGRARNEGNNWAKASIICVLDADDVAEKARTKHVLKHLKGREHEDVYFYGSAMVIDLFCREMGQLVATPFDIEKAIKKMENGIVHSSVAYTRSLALSYPYDEMECQEVGLDDWEHQLRVAADGVPMECTPRILTGYRFREGATTNTRNNERVRALKKKYVEEMKKDEVRAV